MEDYWQRQAVGKPIFTDALWSRPERRDQSGSLTIVGGSAHGFVAVANSYEVALKAKVGQIRVIMPDALKNKLPSMVSARIDDLIFAPSNPSGGLAKKAGGIIDAACEWSGNLLIIGDLGGNAETASLLVEMMANYPTVHTTITRDAVDLLVNEAESVLNHENVTLVLGIAQLKKLARAVYYPRMVTLSLGAKPTADLLHKFTTTYPAAIVLFNDDHLFVAQRGQVVSQDFAQPLKVWSGMVATNVAAWRIWCKDVVPAAATSWSEL